MVFDFDEWAVLAKTDPDGFDRQRQELIEVSIRRCNANERRLRGLQCRIDLERRKAITPLKSCIRLSSMMWDSFFELQHELDHLLHPGNIQVAGGLPKSSIPVFSSAQILPFKHE